MQLLERLQHHIQHISENQAQYDYVYSGYQGGTQVEICINPNSNEFHNFLKSQRGTYNGLRGLFYKGKWYFWNQIQLLHEDVRDGYDFNYKSFIDFVANSVEISHNNTIHLGHWDKIDELLREMTPKECRALIILHTKVLKDLKSRYGTNIEGLKRYNATT